MDTSTIVATERRRTSRLAMAALVMSLLGSPIVTCPVGYLGLAWRQGIDSQVSRDAVVQFVVYLTGASALLAPVALLVSVISLVRIYRRRSRLEGRSLAWAAAVLSVVSIVIWLALAWFF